MSDKTKRGMLIINGVSVIDPSEMTWGLQDVSALDAGRDEAAVMHNKIVGQLRKYSLGWSMISPEDASEILKAINQTWSFECTMWDAMDNAMRTGLYYVGDRSAPIQQWIPDRDDGKLYSKLSFNLIEVKPKGDVPK